MCRTCGLFTRQVYGLSWLVIVAVIVILKIESVSRKKLSTHLNLENRLLKLFLFVGLAVTLAILILFQNLTVGDVLVCLLSFLPTGWALLSIAITCKPLLNDTKFWSLIKAVARGYEFIMGFVIFIPMAVLASFPFISDFQTRLLFNQAFATGLRAKCRLAAVKRQKQILT